MNVSGSQHCMTFVAMSDTCGINSSQFYSYTPLGLIQILHQFNGLKPIAIEVAPLWGYFVISKQYLTLIFILFHFCIFYISIILF